MFIHQKKRSSHVIIYILILKTKQNYIKNKIKAFNFKEKLFNLLSHLFTAIIRGISNMSARSGTVLRRIERYPHTFFFLIFHSPSQIGRTHAAITQLSRPRAKGIERPIFFSLLLSRISYEEKRQQIK